jgi:hypothetical protein
MKTYSYYCNTEMDVDNHKSFWEFGCGHIGYKYGYGETSMYGDGWGDYPTTQLTINYKLGTKE